MQARDAALTILRQVEIKGGYANLVLDEYLKKRQLKIEDRALVTELVNGSIRYRLRLEYILNQLLNKGLESLPGEVARILKLAAYQLLFLEGIPDYAATDEAVKQTVKAGYPSLKGVVNGVLRELVRSKDRLSYPDRELSPALYLSVFYSHPQWLVERWLKRWGLDDTEKLLAHNNTAPPLSLRTNTLRTSRDELAVRLAGEGVRVQRGHLTEWSLTVQGLSVPLTRTACYEEGLFYVQDEGSMLAAAAMAPEPGWEIVDACAGVGGKTTMLAMLMEDEGKVDAVEMYQHKTSLLAANCQRLGINSVRVHTADFLSFRGGKQADGVFLDAPCSGLGVLRRRADARYRKQEKDIQDLSHLQKRLLDHCAGMVKAGGFLVYTTCTVEPEENEQVVDAFLNQHADFEPCDVKEVWPALPAGGVHLKGAGWLLDPVVLNCDGMYVARLRRTKR